MTNRVLTCHPFVSAMNPAREDDMDADEDNYLSPGHSCAYEDAYQVHIQTDLAWVDAHNAPTQFVVDDSGYLFYASFNAVLSNPSRAETHQLVEACAVREPCGEKYCNVVQFLYALHLQQHINLNTSVETHGKNSSSHYFLSDKYGNILEDYKDGLEIILREICDVYTLQQRTADCFILKQMRLTASHTATFYKRHYIRRQALSIPLLVPDPVPI